MHRKTELFETEICWNKIDGISFSFTGYFDRVLVRFEIYWTTLCVFCFYFFRSVWGFFFYFLFKSINQVSLLFSLSNKNTIFFCFTFDAFSYWPHTISMRMYFCTVQKRYLSISLNKQLSLTLIHTDVQLSFWWNETNRTSILFATLS